MGFLRAEGQLKPPVGAGQFVFLSANIDNVFFL
jgi:hypothetical protein